jgi:hypothetical protein
MYRELLEMALADGVLDEYEEERLVDARRRYAITDAQHQTLLMEAKAGLKHGTAGGDYLDLEIPSGRIIPGDGGQEDGGGGEGDQSSSKSAAPRPRRRASTNAEIPAGTAVRELHALFGETVNVIAQLEAALKVPLTIADALGGRQIHSLLLASCFLSSFLLLPSCFLLLASCFLNSSRACSSPSIPYLAGLRLSPHYSSSPHFSFLSSPHVSRAHVLFVLL